MWQVIQYLINVASDDRYSGKYLPINVASDDRYKSMHNFQLIS